LITTGYWDSQVQYWELQSGLPNWETKKRTIIYCWWIAIWRLVMEALQVGSSDTKRWLFPILFYFT